MTRCLALIVPALIIAWSGCSSSPPPAKPEPIPTVVEARGEQIEAPSSDEGDSVAIAAAVNDPGRPDEDRARDEGRRPAEVLAFLGVRPGMKVVDLMSGRGYYAEILARAVGANGQVYAQNNEFVVKRFADGPLTDRLRRLALPTVMRIDSELESPELPEGELDLALMALFYHDTYWQKTDRPKMNSAIFDSLKPGGVFGVVDHFAEEGSRDRDVQTIHRVDAEMVKQEIIDAGFEFVSASDVLRHPEDDRKANVFEEGIRGKTDRFVFKFRKPAGN